MLALLLFACSTEKDPTVVDSAATTDSALDGWSVDPHIQNASFACEGAGWSFALFTEGWIDAAELSIYDIPGQAAVETHPFPTQPTAYDPFGAWDSYTLPLSNDAYSAGISSAFACSLPPGQGLSFRVGVLDRAGVERDCVVWGSDPEGAEPACRRP